MPYTDQDIRPLKDAAEARECAELMASMDPWLRLGRTVEEGLRGLLESGKEIYLVRGEAGPAGFIVIDLRGLVRGYIQTVCVAPGEQGRGLGTVLVGYAERRIHRESPNVFLCVSSFNPDARRLYERLGYRPVGPLTDFMVAGHDELLMRKSLGPWQGFEPR